MLRVALILALLTVGIGGAQEEAILVVGHAEATDSLDPAHGYTQTTGVVNQVTYDTLVTFPDANAPSIAPALVMTTVDIGNAILTFAGLSFLGLGAEPTSPEWGRMVSTGIDLFDQWWTWLFPGLAIFTLVIVFNFIGDGLRDLSDPRMRR